MTSSHSIKLVFNGIIIHLHFSLKNKTIHSTWLQRTFQKEGMFFILNIVMSRALLKNQDYINFSVPFWIIVYLEANRFILSNVSGREIRKARKYVYSTVLFFYCRSRMHPSVASYNRTRYNCVLNTCQQHFLNQRHEVFWRVLQCRNICRGPNHRVGTVLKSPWILREVLEKSLNPIFPSKLLKFLCKSLKCPWIFNFVCSDPQSVFWCSLVVQDRI